MADYSSDKVPWDTLQDNITTVMINGFSNIGRSAFAGLSNMTTFIFTDTNITKINTYAFKGCSNLTTINLPSSVSSIGSDVFVGCSSLKSITIPEKVTSLSDSLFMSCSSLNSITFLGQLKMIGKSAFRDCIKLSSITIPDSLTSIRGSAFMGCSSLTSINIPNNVNTIDYETFSGCSLLQSVLLPNSVIKINYGAFKECSSLTSITFPNNITSIEMRTFANCTSLDSITIPNKVTSIGNAAFANCINLSTINYCGLQDPSFINNSFNNCNPSIHVLPQYESGNFCNFQTEKDLSSDLCICSNDNKDLCNSLTQIRSDKYQCYRVTSTSEFSGHPAAAIFAKGNYQFSPFNSVVVVSMNADASRSTITITGGKSALITQFRENLFGGNFPASPTFSFQVTDEYFETCEALKKSTPSEVDFDFNGATGVHINHISESDNSLLVVHPDSYLLETGGNFLTYNFTKSGKMKIMTADYDFECDSLHTRNLRSEPVITGTGKIKNLDEISPEFVRPLDIESDLSGKAILGIQVACTFVIAVLGVIFNAFILKKKEDVAA